MTDKATSAPRARFEAKGSILVMFLAGFDCVQARQDNETAIWHLPNRVKISCTCEYESLSLGVPSRVSFAV